MKKLVLFLLVLVIGCSISSDLLHPGFPVTHDGQDHIARIANFFVNLQQGNLIPRWAPSLNWGYGHPILEFLYPLPSYVASLLHFLGFSLIDSTKIVYAVGPIFSGVAMFWFVNEILGVEAGLLSGVLYMMAPYRIVDLYVRGDIGENLAFAFIPVVLYAIHKLYKTDKPQFSFLGAFGLALLILAHNAISLIILPFIIFYALFLLYRSDKKKFLFWNYTLVLIWGLSLSAFFWLPALLEGKFTLRNIVTKGEYVKRFVALSTLFYSPWNYGQSGQFTLEVGIVQWVALLLSPTVGMYLYLKKRKEWVLIAGISLYTLLCIWLMLPSSNIVWQRVILLQNFQFPWRFLGGIVVATTILAGYGVSISPIRYKLILSIVVAAIAISLSFPTWHAKSYAEKPESFFTGIYLGTTDTGESAPIWSVRFMGQAAESPMQFIEGVGSIAQQKRTVTNHIYKVSAATNGKLLENTLYFPGWRVLVDGKQVPVEFQNQLYRGLMTFTIPSGGHIVEVSYHESALRLLGDMLSGIGIAFTIFYAFLLKKKNI